MRVLRVAIATFLALGLVIFAIPVFPVLSLVMEGTQTPKSESGLLSPEIPNEIDFLDGSCQDSACFYDFAWKEFIALNWPAGPGGKPDKSVTIGESPNSRRVWESYETPDQVFQPEDSQAVQLDDSPEGTRNQLQSIKNQFHISKGAPSYPSYDEISKQESAPSAPPDEEIIQVTGDPLIDQHNNYILYGIRLNPEEAEQIRNNNWQYAACLKQLSGDELQFIPSAIELKTAWRIFDNDTPAKEKARYYTISVTPEGIFDDPSIDKKILPVLGERKEISPLELGLIGFHINHKIHTKNAEPGIPNITWTWATFSHIDTTPLDAKKPEQKNYLLYNSQCLYNSKGQKDCKPNHLYAEKPFLWSNASPHAIDKNGNPQTPTQVELVGNLTPAIPNQNAKKANEKWRKKLTNSEPNNVWANYYLDGIQWQSNVIKIPLANASLETYVPLKAQSCLGCHQTAKLPGGGKADFSFLPKKFSLKVPLTCPSS